MNKTLPFYQFTDTFNVVERPRDKLVPDITYVIVSINCCFLTSLSLFFLEAHKTKKGQLGSRVGTLPDRYKALTLETLVTEMSPKQKTSPYQ